MSALIVPASLWRRLIAAVYDGLLLIGIWGLGLLLETIVRAQILGLPGNRSWLQAFLFLLGLLFFGWFWTRGGQTLGMRAWRLQVRRIDGSPVRWGIVPGRFAAMLATWFAALSPLALMVPHFASRPHAHEGVGLAVLLAAGAAVTVLLDARRRAWCDFVAGTEVVQLPKGS